MKIPFFGTKSNHRLRNTFFLIASLWTILIVALTGATYRQANTSALDAALSNTRNMFFRDMAYRRWATGHGGVYVPVTPETPPNPYLAGVPERDITTPSGRKLTLMNPAYMTRQVHELGREQYGLRGHITSLRPIRPENAPDEWEKEALLAFEQGEKEVSSLQQLGQETYFRLMRPMITESACVKCHAVHGYKVGDIRGGISISAPWAPYRQALNEHLRTLILAYGVIWAIGLLGLLLGWNRIYGYLSEIKQTGEALQVSLNEKELLFRELFHRTKNNMQVITGFLNLQSEGIADEKVQEMFKKTTGRIKAMALVHEKLYQAKDLSRIDLKEYIEELAGMIMESHDGRPGSIALQLELESVFTTIDAAVPCGLILNELISNAVKHAFPGERSGWVRIVLRQQADGEIEIGVEDNGVGLPEGLDIRKGGSLGLESVVQLAEHQLRGQVEVRRGGGARFRIRFSDLHYKARMG